MLDRTEDRWQWWVDQEIEAVQLLFLFGSGVQSVLFTGFIENGHPLLGANILGCQLLPIFLEGLVSIDIVDLGTTLISEDVELLVENILDCVICHRPLGSAVYEETRLTHDHGVTSQSWRTLQSYAVFTFLTNGAGMTVLQYFRNKGRV